ncbi:hypothetical protein TrVE_jg569 [Triparma verrucosa]|uniref:Large ribosomal subunit protein uL11m n=2 Tax=Triparma TaxID=722752 RepID=A0A9W7AEG1_9STRA|nr:hypothetical protein TrST_g4376 [Triparma strigata]GMI00112.1 hypothetical protein TrVE_jg569 [Triparma verrucosa]
MSVVRSVMLKVPSATAKPGPSIGQALGPLGVNMAQFVKEFNDRTSAYTPGIPLPVKLTALSDRTFTFTIRTPSTSHLILQSLGLTSGSESPGTKEVGELSMEAVYEIAKVKVKDEANRGQDLEGMCKTVVGTARSMGVSVRDFKE